MIWDALLGKYLSHESVVGYGEMDRKSNTKQHCQCNCKGVTNANNIDRIFRSLCNNNIVCISWCSNIVIAQRYICKPKKGEIT